MELVNGNNKRVWANNNEIEECVSKYLKTIENNNNNNNDNNNNNNNNNNKMVKQCDIFEFVFEDMDLHTKGTLDSFMSSCYNNKELKLFIEKV